MKLAKNLFIKSINTRTNRWNVSSLKSKIYLFKNFLFGVWFFTNFKINDFFLIYNFIIINKFFNTLKFNFLTLLSFGVKNFFFFQKWQYLEPFLLNKNFWFSLIHLVNKKFLFNFNLYYLNNLLIFSQTFNWLITFFNVNRTMLKSYLLLNKSVEVIFEKLTFIYFNSEIFLKNLFIFNDFKKKFKLLFVDVFSKIKNFDKFYLSFQAFLNNNLYLAWQTLFLSNISTASLNFLLLKNFNTLLFWIGDKSKNYMLQNFLFWGWENIFFAKGEPYYTFIKGIYKNTLITNSNYYNFAVSKELIFLRKNKFFIYFFEKNFIIIKKFKFFNNKLVTQYLF